MWNMPDIITPMLWVLAITIPLAAWKAIEILIWFFGNLSISWGVG